MAHSRTTAHTTWMLAAWAGFTLLPMAAYAQPLWQSALADTPTAYLIWIPVLAVGWGLLALAGAPRYVDDGEIDGLLGFALAASTGALLVIGPIRWPYTFVYENVGLLLWPLWALGIAWLLFGVGVTRRLIGPLAYLVLAWPPLLTLAAGATQSLLVRLAVATLDRVTPYTPWFHASLPAGTFLVRHAATWVPVLVSNACSGADSLLAAAILLPLLLTQFRGPSGRKLLLVGVTLAGALVFNLVRLALIISSLHAFGVGFALGVLHPVLGFILFAVLGGLLAWLAPPLGLRLRTLPSLERPTLALAGRGRVALSGAFALALGVGLWPLLSLPPGAPGKPIPVASADPAGFLPVLPGFRRSFVGRYDDASILGPGARSVAVDYSAPGGLTLLAEVWVTPSLSALTSYGYRNCLLFHGDTLVAARNFQLMTAQVASSYAVLLPPNQPGGPRGSYADVEWTGAVSTPTGLDYLRFSVAVTPQSASWPQRLLASAPPSAVSGYASLAAGPAFGRWPQVMQREGHGVESFSRLLATAVRQHLALAS